MENILMVVGAALAGFAVLDAIRPGRGAADHVLRAVGGIALLTLAGVAAAGGSSAAAVLATAVACPLVAGPMLPWVFAALKADRHGNARAEQP